MTINKLSKHIEDWQQEDLEGRCSINILADKKEDIVRITFSGDKQNITFAMIGALINDENFRKTVETAAKLAEKIIKKQENED